jgi:hypothetical protein
MGLQFSLAGMVCVALLAPSVGAQQPDAARQRPTGISFRDAKPTFDLLHESWPAELRGMPPARLETSWPDWVRKRNLDVRARVARGDEDSLVNFWLYGRTFTSLPAARHVEDAGTHDAVVELASRRLDDLLRAITATGHNERLTFVREFFERRGLNPATSTGREQIRRFLIDARQRALREHDEYEARIRDVQRSGEPGEALAVHSTLFRDRGLSSDTSILIGFAVERALRGMIEAGSLRGPVKHVGIIGPGLDFTNKADGHDSYPQQSLQPFAVVDSLLRLGLADAAQLRITTLDVNPRVNEHLEGARRRAARGDGYVLHTPLSRSEAWDPAFLRFWNAFGDRVGDPLPVEERGGADATMMRAVRVRPALVASVRPVDMNIVFERLNQGGTDDRLDLLIATNVLVYYDRFEQSLAVTNAAAMLRPGGVLLTNNAVLPIAPLKAAAHHLFVNYSPGLSEHVFWYQREDD